LQFQTTRPPLRQRQRQRHTMMTTSLGRKTAAAEITKKATTTTTMRTTTTTATTVIEESVWRTAAHQHQARIRRLLEPGLTELSHPLNAGHFAQHRHHRPHTTTTESPIWTALDPQHPVYNFLIDYYGLKGSQGPRRLARWSPAPRSAIEITTGGVGGGGGVLLQGATEEDLGDLLHLRGAILEPPHGILYSAKEYFAASRAPETTSTETTTSNEGVDNGSSSSHRSSSSSFKTMAEQMRPFLWNYSILQRTLAAEPVLHCFGLHEWAMLYQPIVPGGDELAIPKSQQYQAHLPLRVDRATIQQAVERKGVHCTHVDAVRFFTPAAERWNVYGAPLPRAQQVQLEQPACLHAHMDLLKLTLRLQPFVDAALVADTLELALQARCLDVAASPYDASQYHIDPVPIETPEGRALYRQQQYALMQKAAPVRHAVRQAYQDFLAVAFDYPFPEDDNEKERIKGQHN